jgi:hypothetical protein
MYWIFLLVDLLIFKHFFIYNQSLGESDNRQLQKLVEIRANVTTVLPFSTNKIWTQLKKDVSVRCFVKATFRTPVFFISSNLE